MSETDIHRREDLVVLLQSRAVSDDRAKLG